MRKRRHCGDEQIARAAHLDAPHSRGIEKNKRADSVNGNSDRNSTTYESARDSLIDCAASRVGLIALQRCRRVRGRRRDADVMV